MNNGIVDKLRIGFLVTTAIIIFAAEAVPQKRDSIKPPAETATLAETQTWLVGAIGKYAAYKTRVTTMTITNAKFEGCSFSFTETRKSGSISTATMGATRTTNSVKEDILFDVARLASDGISVSDHIYPEIQTLELKFADDRRIVEIVVKREASDAIKTALTRIQRLCTAKN